MPKLSLYIKNNSVQFDAFLLKEDTDMASLIKDMTDNNLQNYGVERQRDWISEYTETDIESPWGAVHIIDKDTVIEINWPDSRISKESMRFSIPERLNLTTIGPGKYCLLATIEATGSKVGEISVSKYSVFNPSEIKNTQVAISDEEQVLCQLLQCNIYGGLQYRGEEARILVDEDNWQSTEQDSRHLCDIVFLFEILQDQTMQVSYSSLESGLEK